MSKTMLLIVMLLGLTAAACGYRESITQKSELSYIKITGNAIGTIVHVGDLQPFQVTDTEKLYQVTPGKHIIKVYRGADLRVNRIVILYSGVTTEVHVP